jgi:TRAP transporter TAXI family solute receptor
LATGLDGRGFGPVLASADDGRKAQIRMQLLAKAASVVLIAGTFIAPALAAESYQTVTIASGRPGGLYHPVAGAICKLLNEGTDEHGIVCTIGYGVGSITNIEELRDGEVDLAMGQSDIQRDAVNGTGPFSDAGPFEAMRSIASLFVEQLTVVARADRDVATLEDLKGKRLNPSVPGSGQYVLMQQLLEAEGFAPEDVELITEHEGTNAAEALCNGEYDAFSLAVGHPSPLIKEAAAACDITLVPVEGPAVEQIIAEEPLYTTSEVPADTYRNIDDAVPGLGLSATLMATDEVDAEVVYQITKALFEGLDRLREASPIFRSLSAEQMANEGLTAPLHEGAARYYSEVGLR